MSAPKPRYRVLTGREEKRELERRERKSAVQIPFSRQQEIMRRSEAVSHLQRNGITIEDLQKNYDLGWEKGFNDASQPVIRTCYAAVCTALHDLYGFGSKRCKDVLNAIDQKIMYTLTTKEAIDEVWEKVGLHIDFKNIVEDRIVENTEEDE